MADGMAEHAAVPLDDVDQRFFAELSRVGRMPVTQMAENVHLSRGIRSRNLD